MPQAEKRSAEFLLRAILNVLSGQTTDSTGSSAVVTRAETYTEVHTGELAGSATAVAMPDVPCKLAKLKALPDNAGNVYIGVGGVTVANGATDQTTGYVLDAGDETGWLPISNLNRLTRICDNAGDDLTYLVLR